ncbi:MAG: lipid A-modifier LpxR family protein, partial [Brevundimonas sp.]
ATGGWTGYAPDRSSQSAASSRDVWFGNAGYDDRLRLRAEGALRRLDGSPLPPGPLDPATFDAEHYDLSYTRGWTETLGQTASGLDVTLTPHVGVGVGTRGGTTEAGATLRIGRGIERLVPDGGDAFGERPRWYLYAAGSGRAVGYNFARNRDGDFARSGVSQDSGNFLGDASLGVAMRRGPVHSSLSVVYREIETEGLRAGHGVDTDVTEGLIAFQLSIRPE